jgi:uncharacterized membrane protein
VEIATHSSGPPVWRRVLVGVLMVAYPGLIYVALSRWDVSVVAAITVGMLGSIAVLRGLPVAGQRDKSQGFRAMAPLAPAIVLAGLAGLVRDPRFLLAAPFLISLALLWAFARTLRAGRVPMVERFARMQESTLPPGGDRHCRSVTKVWVGFFIVNAGLSGALALWGPLELWTLYTGLIVYLLIGATFTVEYIVRKAKFRRYGRGPHDWLLAKVFPPPSRTP